jgi:hypothetical protein
VRALRGLGRGFAAGPSAPLRMTSVGWGLWFPPFRKLRERMGHPFRAARREDVCLARARQKAHLRCGSFDCAQDDNRSWGRVIAFPPFRKLRDRTGHPFRAARPERQILRCAKDDSLMGMDGCKSGSSTVNPVIAEPVIDYVEPSEAAVHDGPAEGMPFCPR